MKSKTRTKTVPKPAKVSLILSKDLAPKLTLRPGLKFEVASVTIVEPVDLTPVKLAATLCGGTSTCLALIDIGPENDPV